MISEAQRLAILDDIYRMATAAYVLLPADLTKLLNKIEELIKADTSQEAAQRVFDTIYDDTAIDVLAEVLCRFHGKFEYNVTDILRDFAVSFEPLQFAPFIKLHKASFHEDQWNGIHMSNWSRDYKNIVDCELISPVLNAEYCYNPNALHVQIRRSLLKAKIPMERHHQLLKTTFPNVLEQLRLPPNEISFKKCEYEFAILHKFCSLTLPTSHKKNDALNVKSIKTTKAARTFAKNLLQLTSDFDQIKKVLSLDVLVAAVEHGVVCDTQTLLQRLSSTPSKASSRRI